MNASLRNPAFLAGAAVLLISAVALNYAVAALKWNLRKLPIEAEQKTQALPAETRSWKSVHEWRESAEVVEELGTENYLNRIYKRVVEGDTESEPETLQVHLAYYTGMVDTVPHVPERCMVGGGWTIASGGGAQIVRVPLDLARWSVDRDATKEFASDESPIYRARLQNALSARLPRGIENLSLNCTTFERPGSADRMVAGYFFIANGGLSSTAEGVRLLAFDLRSDYAFYLKVQVSSSRVRTAEELAALAADFLQEMLPEIMACVPDWIEVQRGRYPDDNPNRKNADQAARTASRAGV